MKYAVEMGTGAMIYIPSFMNTGPDIQKLLREIRTHTHRQQGDIISILTFFEGKQTNKNMYSFTYRHTAFL
jgi:hypothetical protein